MNEAILPIKYIPTFRQNLKERVTVKIEMMEPEKPEEDLGFVFKWEFVNGKY